MLTNKEAAIELAYLKKIVRENLMWGGRGSRVIKEERTSRLLEALEMGENSLNICDTFTVKAVTAEDSHIIEELIKPSLNSPRPVMILETSKPKDHYTEE